MPAGGHFHRLALRQRLPFWPLQTRQRSSPHIWQEKQSVQLCFLGLFGLRSGM
jgi:hypothetical protein